MCVIKKVQGGVSGMQAMMCRNSTYHGCDNRKLGIEQGVSM